MKRFLLSCTLLVIASIGTRVFAQCSINDFSVVIKSISGGSGNVQVTMDISFTGDFNNGNKYAFIHLWETSPVNNYPNLSFNNPPTSAELSNAAATIVIAEPGKSSASLNSSYPPDAGVAVKYGGVGFSKTGINYSMTNVVINVSTGTQPVTLKGDIWASQAGNAGVVHCFNTGSITLLLNNPVITGFKQCVNPRLINLSFSNANTMLDESIVANVYIDANSNGTVDAGDIDITNSLSPALPSPMNLPANSASSFLNLSYSPYSSQGIYDGKPIIVRATATAPNAASVTITKSNIDFLGSCISLPVSLKSFTVTRNKSVVTLKWETASEQNSDGFAIERNTSGTWQQVAVVASKALNGNSSSTLNYQYEDLNSARGLSQYRIRQFDMDSRSTYSEVRIVRGVDQPGKTIVYPNPSHGMVSIVFEQTDVTRDIVLVDISGRMIRSWKNSADNNIEITNLTPGMYSLQVTTKETGERSVNKIVVSGNK